MVCRLLTRLHNSRLQLCVQGATQPQPVRQPPPARAPSQGFQKTGLGERVATMFVKVVGKSTLGLAYGLSGAEMLLAPAMPSTTARAGGIFMPIINSLSLASGSEPGQYPTVPAERRR